MQVNCWEFNKCGQLPKPNGLHEFGACPVVSETRLNGVHGGVNAGRACWAVNGSMCGGKVQKEFEKKLENCLKCEFYRKVKFEEGADFITVAVLLKKLRETD